MTEREQLIEMLGDWKWRVCSGKLYKIKDKDGKVVPFIPNPYQKYLIENVHYKNLILKARQLGFSTMIQILMLDQALFCDNVACGVIAQGLKESKSIFDNKIKFAYDQLPEWLRNERTLTKNSSDTLEFNNGSSIYVSTSFRGGTLQYLHISEYGKICAKYPERAKEINTGALEAVGAGNYVFIESTAEGKSGDFYDKSMKAEKLMLEEKILNEHEYKFFFFPWWEVQEYRLDDPYLVLTEETLRYFRELEDDHGIIVDDQQKRWYQVKSEEKHDDMFREYPSISEEAFKVAIQGSYYKKWINIAIKDGRLCSVPYDRSLELYIGMDIGGAGGGDDMTVWFFQIFGKEIRLVDYWEGTGYSMKDLHSEVLSQKEYRYARVFMPFDAKVHSQNDGKTREDTMKELGYTVTVLERGAISDRIQMVRDNFKDFWFDKQRCSDALDKLAEYRRKWSESAGTFLDGPEHANSHCADGFGYSIIGAIEKVIPGSKASKLMSNKPTFHNKLTGSMQGPGYNNNNKSRFGLGR